MRSEDLRHAAAGVPGWARSAELTDTELLAGVSDLDWNSPYRLGGKLDSHWLVLSSATVRGSLARRVHVGLRLKLRTDRPAFTAFHTFQRPPSRGYRDIPSEHGGVELVCSPRLDTVLAAANRKLARMAHLRREGDGPMLFTRSAFVAAYLHLPRL